MDFLKNQTNKLIVLYSGFYDHENVGKININPNFYYLTKIYLPNIIFLINQRRISIYINANKHQNTNSIKEKIKSIVNQKIKFLSINELGNLLSKNKNEILTLNNIDQISNIISFQLNNYNQKILEDYCFANRQIKTDLEIKLIQKACFETCKGIRKTIKELNNKKYKKCYDIVNSINCNLSEQNLTEHSYPPICSVGRENILLHNPSYEGSLKKGDILLLDIGFKYNGYCADITRTYCIKNKFTKNQKVIYDIVLKVNKYCISQIKDNLDYRNLEDKCYIMIAELLEKKKLFNNEMNLDTKIIMGKKFMPHRLSHNLGIETHDCGDLNILKENMVITIEPGIYFNDILLLDTNINQLELKKYYNIGGMRIEDVVLVQKEGYKVLSNLAK